MKLSIAKLQILEMLLNQSHYIAHHQQRGYKRVNPFAVVLNVDGHLMLGSLNAYDDDRYFPVSNHLEDSKFISKAQSSAKYFPSINFEQFAAKFWEYRYYNESFFSGLDLEMLLNDVLRFMENSNIDIDDAQYFGNLSLKNVTLLDSGLKLPFVLLQNQPYDLVSIVLNEGN